MNKTPRTETVVKMAVGPMREYAIIEHAQTLERELLKAREERDEARRELDIQLESIKFHMERVPVREHPFRADDAKLWGEEVQ